MYAVILNFETVLGVFDTSEKAYQAQKEIICRTHHEYDVIVRPVNFNSIAWFKLGLD